jgi:hypothetical protein
METRKGNKDKKSSTKHYTENKTLRNTNLTKKQVLRKGKKFLFH